jgi:lysophospholipase L1-like esterase
MAGNRQLSRGLPKGAPQRGHGGTLSVQFANTELPVSRQYEQYDVDGAGTVVRLTPLPKGFKFDLHFKGPVRFTNGSFLRMPNGSDRTFAAGDFATLLSLGDGAYRCVNVQSANPGPIFVFEGDSISDVSLYGTWPLRLSEFSAYFARGVPYYYASGGSRADIITGEYATQGGQITLPSGADAYYFLRVGTNDIGNGSSAATIYNNLKTIWAAARATGYKVVASTVSPSVFYTGNSALEAVRVDLNNLILGDTTLYDRILRPDALFPDTNDNVYYLDGTHFTDAGNRAFARHVVRVVLGTELTYAEPVDDRDFDNLVINGAMEVMEEATPTGGFVAECFRLLQNGTMVLTATQDFDAPSGLWKSLKVSVGTAKATLASGEFAFINTKIEAFRTSKLRFGAEVARPITLYFWVKAHRAGMYSGAFNNDAVNRTYNFVYTINTADTWEFKAIPLTGDMLGTWVGNTNGYSLQISFLIAGHSALLSSAGAWLSGGFIGATGSTNGVAATSDVFRLSGVGLVEGLRFPSAQRAPFTMRSYDRELLLCRRYLRPVYNARGTAISSTTIRASIDHAGMRAAPAASYAAAANWTDVATSNPSQSAPSASVSANSAESGQYDLANFAGLTVGRAYEQLPLSSPMILNARMP